MHHEEFDQFEEATYSHAGQQENDKKDGGLLDGTGLGNGARQQVLAQESLQVFSGLAYSPQQTATMDFSSTEKSESVWPQLGKISSAHAISATPIMFDFAKSNSHQEPNNHTGQLSYLDLIDHSQNQPTNPPFSTQSTPQDFLSMTLDNAEKPKTDLLLEFPTQKQRFFSNPIEQSQNRSNSNENNVESFEWKFNWDTVQPQQSTHLYAAQGLTREDDSLFNQMSSNPVEGTEDAIVTSSQEVKVESVVAGEGKEEFIQLSLNIEEKKQAQHEDHFNLGTVSQPVNIQSQVEVIYTIVQPIQQSDPLDLALFDPAATKQEVAEERKQSDDFEFGLHVNNHTQKEPEQVRKESEQFEFQSESVQNTPTVIENAQVQEEEPIHTQEKEEEKQPEPEMIQPAQQAQQDDDDFGDFQETTVTQTKEPQAQTIQTQHIPQNEQQDNQIRLNQNYEYPQDSEPYNTKKQELQSFVDSLPDYSFLFAKAFFT